MATSVASAVRPRHYVHTNEPLAEQLAVPATALLALPGNVDDTAGAIYRLVP